MGEFEDKAPIGSLAWHEQQERRDAAGQLRAIKKGGVNHDRLARGEITRDELEQEWDDGIARIGSIDDETWDRLTAKEAHEAMVFALGFDPHPDHHHTPIRGQS